jgi:hypothetical protein
VQPLAHCNAALKQEGAYLIDNGGALADQPLTHAVQGLQVELIDSLCRSTIAPRLSCPTKWNEFLPISMPITAIALLGFCDMACSWSLVPPCQLF